MKASVHLWKAWTLLASEEQVVSSLGQVSAKADSFGTKLPPKSSPPSGEFGESPKSAEPTFPPLSKRTLRSKKITPAPQSPK